MITSITPNHHPYQDLNFSALSLSEIQQTSQYEEILHGIKSLPKVELHAHLGGAVSRAFLKKYSDPENYEELIKFIDQINSGMDYSQAFQVFKLIGKTLNSNQMIEEAAFDFCHAQSNDHVIYSELRTGLKRLDGSFEDYLKAVLRGLKKGMDTYPVRVNLLLSLRRDTSEADAFETINLAIKYRDHGITGIDVSGESILGDGRGIYAALQQAKENNFPITLHIGEHHSESPQQQLHELTIIQPQRIGHGVHLCSEAWDWIRQNQTPVEVCLKSALAVGMIQKPSEHPFLEMFLNGHPVMFCTDDSTIFGDLSDELALAACLCNLSLQRVQELQEKALEYIFNADFNTLNYRPQL